MTTPRTPASHPIPRAFSRSSRRSILAGSIAPLSFLLIALSGPSALADAIFAPGDQILGGKAVGDPTLFTGFNIGVVGTTGGANNWPGGESPDHIIDGVGAKYLNFGVSSTGFLVSPTFNGGNGSVVSSIQLWTANDAEPRDPGSYEIWGTNTALDFTATSFSLDQFTRIAGGTLALPSGRNGGGQTALNNSNSQTVTFANTAGFKDYLIFFPTVKTPASANSMQIGEVQLFGIAAFTSLTWTGNASNLWNVENALNWITAGAPSTYSDTNGVTFDDTAPPTKNNVTIQNGGVAVKPAAVFFQNNTINYTIDGDAIASTGTLTINGTGSVTLNNTNSYTGGTVVNSGTLNVGAAGSLGSGSLTINNLNTAAGTAVKVNFASAQTIGSLAGTISTPSEGINTAAITLAGTLTVNQTADGAYTGTIAGTGGLVKNGTGALTLSGVNTYAGPTTINEGVLRSSAPGDNPQGALPAGQPVVVNTGAKLIFGADDGAGYYAGSVSSITVNGGTVLGGANTHSTLPALTLNGGTIAATDAGNFSNGAVLNYILDGNVTTVAAATPSTISAPTILLRKDGQNTGTSSPLTFEVPRGTAPIDLAISSVILDKGAGLIKSGNGILSLSNANKYTGATVVNGGTVLLGNPAALGTGAVTLNTGGVLSLSSTPVVSGFTNFLANGGATFNSTNSVNLTDNGASQARSVFSPEMFSFEKGFTTSFLYTAGGNRAADGFTFTIQSVSPTAVGGGGGGLGYSGIANSTAVEFNIYTGGGQPVGTAVASGTTGTYLASEPVNLANGNPIAITLTYDPALQTMTETLVDSVANTTYTHTFEFIDLAASIGGTSGFVGFTGATGGAVASQKVENFTFNNFTQGVSLGNNITIAPNAAVGFDIVPLSAGGAGSASLKGTLAIGANATVNVTGGATASDTSYLLTGGATTIAGSTTINVANNGTGTGAFVLGAVGETTTSASLIKTGSGTLAINGSATYTGATTVNAGTLVVNGSVSGLGTTVNSGATVAGTGTLGIVTVASGGTLSPGNGIGTLNTGLLSLQGGSTFHLDLGATLGDQVKVTGAGTLSGVVNLSLTLLADPVEGTTFTLLDGSASLAGYAGGARLSYLGTPLTQDQQFSVTNGGFTQDFLISYNADNGRDITLMAVPEPGVGASLLGGLGLLLGLRRRRRD